VPFFCISWPAYLRFYFVFDGSLDMALCSDDWCLRCGYIFFVSIPIFLGMGVNYYLVLLYIYSSHLSGILIHFYLFWISGGPRWRVRHLVHSYFVCTQWHNYEGRLNPSVISCKPVHRVFKKKRGSFKLSAALFAMRYRGQYKYTNSLGCKCPYWYSAYQNILSQNVMRSYDT